MVDKTYAEAQADDPLAGSSMDGTEIISMTQRGADRAMTYQDIVNLFEVDVLEYFRLTGVLSAYVPWPKSPDAASDGYANNSLPSGTQLTRQGDGSIMLGGATGYSWMTIDLGAPIIEAQIFSRNTTTLGVGENSHCGGLHFNNSDGSAFDGTMCDVVLTNLAGTMNLRVRILDFGTGNVLIESANTPLQENAFNSEYGTITVAVNANGHVTARALNVSGEIIATANWSLGGAITNSFIGLAVDSGDNSFVLTPSFLAGSGAGMSMRKLIVRT